MSINKTLNGMPILIAPPICIPRVRLSEGVSVSLEFRREMDAWLLEFFGPSAYVETVQDGMVAKINGNLLMNRRTYESLDGYLESVDIGPLVATNFKSPL